MENQTQKQVALIEKIRSEMISPEYLKLYILQYFY